MILLRNKQVEKLTNLIVAIHIISEDAINKAANAGGLDKKDFIDYRTTLCQDTLLAASIIGSRDKAVKAILDYHVAKMKQEELMKNAGER